MPQFDITPEEEAGTYEYLRRQFLVKAKPVKSVEVDLHGKTAIITGSNTGLGLETAHQLLALGLSRLIIAVRTTEKGEKARNELLKDISPGSCDIQVWHLDLASYESVIQFAARAEGLDSLHIAILNAALFKVTEDFDPATGFEESIQVNYLSNVLLTALLLPILKHKAGAQPGRLVLVSSDTAAWAKFEERSSNPILAAFKKPSAHWVMQERYGTTKLLGQLFVTELVKRVPASAVIVSAANPGFCYGSELGRGGNGTLLGFLYRIFARIMGRSCSVGARSLVHAAVSFGKDAHGQYIETGKVRP